MSPPVPNYERKACNGAIWRGVVLACLECVGKGPGMRRWAQSASDPWRWSSRWMDRLRRRLYRLHGSTEAVCMLLLTREVGGGYMMDCMCRVCRRLIIEIGGLHWRRARVTAMGSNQINCI